MDLWINGQWTRSVDGGSHTLTNPATATAHATVTSATQADVDIAVSSAVAALTGGWRDTVPADRQRLLLLLADLIEANAEELSRLEVEDTGRPYLTMLEGEIPFLIDNLRFFAGAARSVSGTAAGEFSNGYTSMIKRQPVGVVGAIAPWNFPLIMAVWKVGPALAGGCSVVLKPALNTPRTSLRLAELATEAGFPDGVFNVVTGGDGVGQRLVSHPDVAMISLTGSSATGRRVMAGAAPTLKRLHLELGGKAPLIAFEDVDVGAMAHASVLAATYNSGQDCTAATRVYAQRNVFDDVVGALSETMAQVVVGDPMDPGTDIGPLISNEHRQHVDGFVHRAAAGGATITLGGECDDRPGWFYPPTLVVGAEQQSEVVQDEVFGPVLVVLPFDGETDAVDLANDVRFGLAASVWTSDVGRALRVSDALDFGVVWVNDHLPIASEMPHGGMKQSGFGKDMSADSVLAHTVAKHVMIKHKPAQAPDGFRPA